MNYIIQFKRLFIKFKIVVFLNISQNLFKFKSNYII